MSKGEMIEKETALGIVPVQHLPAGMSKLAIVVFRLTRFLQAEVGALVDHEPDVGLVSWRVLRGLSLTLKATQKQLVAFTGTEQGQLSKVLREMQKQDLVQIAKHSDDKRVSLFALTSKGRAVHARLLPQVTTFTDAIDNALLPDEQAQFFAMCDKIRTAAQNASGRQLK